MPTYNTLITRTDVAGFMPEPAVVELQTVLERTSIAMSLFRRIPMASQQTKIAVLDALPHVYWVNGDTGLKQTTKATWAGATITAEELAVIVPIPEAVLADANVDIWARVRPLLANAFAQKIDDAVVFGLNKPASFPAALVPGAAAATPTQKFVNADAVEAIQLGLDFLESHDVNVSNVVGRATLRGAIRRKLATMGGAAELGGAPDSLFGYGLTYPSGTFTWPANMSAIEGDFNLAVLGMRQDITYKILDQSVISDDAGVVIFNLAQQDSVALRAVMRVGFAVGNASYEDASGNLIDLYPFATAFTA